MKSKSEDNTAVRVDVLTTLAIAALIHQTNEGVRDCAKELIKRAPRSICKNTLYPLSESHYALDIIVDEVVHPSQEMVIGTAYLDSYEYDIVVTYRESLSYDTDTMRDMIIRKFVQRGVVKGTLKLSFRYLFTRGYYTCTVDMLQVLADSNRRRAA